MKIVIKILWGSHKDLPFLPERKKLEKVEKLDCSLENIKICHTHKRFKTILKYWIKIKRSTQNN